LLNRSADAIQILLFIVKNKIYHTPKSQEKRLMEREIK
jgi:hypothetical protein